MNNDMFMSMYLPRVLFTTRNHFDDYCTDDMQCGDLNDWDFQMLGLKDISARVDPIRCLQFDRQTIFNIHALDLGHQPTKGRLISRQQCAEIMFDEMKALSTQFASGQYAPLIGKLIDHFHYGNGLPWSGELLNRAYRDIISGFGASDVLMKIKSAINQNLYTTHQASLDYYFFTVLKKQLWQSILPKFNRFTDKFNGLGISVHDIYAQQIKLMSFHRYAKWWEGTLSFKGQDHFGLGKEDITNVLYKNFRFFRIWFFLQHHRDYAYKPFMTNMYTHVSVEGHE